ncbi:MAG TPA: hypothetical protein VG815_16530, partial [Chloroflexota bacterium]|nr:hypothetical protein [Chloroflexota bacterium]
MNSLSSPGGAIASGRLGARRACAARRARQPGAGPRRPAQALGVVNIFIPSEPTEHGLPQHSGGSMLAMLAIPAR